MNSDFEYVENDTKKSELVFLIQEYERNRIARDLHDTSLQDLTHLVHQLELMGLYMDKDPIKAHMELVSIRKSLKSTIDDIRSIIFNLRPMMIDDIGLKETFEVFFKNLKKESYFNFIIDIEPVIPGEPSFLLNIYRIVVECVTNAIKHSGATEIMFRCKIVDNSVCLWIEDNGKGYNREDINIKNHYGLSILYERIEILDGKIEYNTSVGNGTKIFISIPL